MSGCYGSGSALRIRNMKNGGTISRRFARAPVARQWLAAALALPEAVVALILAPESAPFADTADCGTEVTDCAPAPALALPGATEPPAVPAAPATPVAPVRPALPPVPLPAPATLAAVPAVPCADCAD